MNETPAKPTIAKADAKEGGVYITTSHDLLEDKTKLFRTIHSGNIWQMSHWVREQRKSFRKSLRTKDFGEAKQLLTDESVEIKARLRNGEMVFAKTASALVDACQNDQEVRTRSGRCSGRRGARG